MARTPKARQDAPEPVTPEEALIPRVLPLEPPDPLYNPCMVYPFSMIVRDKDGYIVREEPEDYEDIGRAKLEPNPRWYFKILPTKSYEITLGAQTAARITKMVNGRATVVLDDTLYSWYIWQHMLDDWKLPEHDPAKKREEIPYTTDEFKHLPQYLGMVLDELINSKDGTNPSLYTTAGSDGKVRDFRPTT